MTLKQDFGTLKKNWTHNNIGSMALIRHCQWTGSKRTMFCP
jgi:hypothetical protein